MERRSQPAGQTCSIAALIPAHQKDFSILPETIRSLKRCVRGLDRIFVVTAEPAPTAHDEGVEWFAESHFPFCLNDFKGCLPSAGWVFQQALKLEAPFFIPELQEYDNFLVVDADTVWLEETHFLDEDGRALMSSYGASDIPVTMRSRIDLHRYDDFVGQVLPGLTKRMPCLETAVVHHALMQRVVLEDMRRRILEAHPSCTCLWEVLGRLGKAGVHVSEYELYFAFAWRFHSNRVLDSPLCFAVTKEWVLTRALKEWLADLSAGVPVVYLVAHSHLRLDETLTAADLSTRIGVINGQRKAREAAGASTTATITTPTSSIGEGGSLPNRASEVVPAVTPRRPQDDLMAILHRQGVFDR
mmetsp:Transcript_55968/g.76363  ORF Transcript_55968/g.76363 Transcript_55968/m.76363 type:complete len:358 (-) Transcript_55968:322-1395(-)|eukprot:CAMPEP_0185762252 /NCGR_PEP_ID=MMETSP1174-20130828/21232_1 /TAXON_ID=35687 /ORGANISM="Dictyocha speculum, Strain CCMP1381" /LENGTH=357 /DNA_ID=CAMNT_0028443849 /DNA_START=156 /DNA_END=1229 /DNA_ORIENTATION=+